MLHKLSLDANTIVTLYWQILEHVYTNIFLFGKQILLDFDTRHVGLSNSMASFGMAHEIKMMCVQQGFPSKPLAGYS